MEWRGAVRATGRYRSFLLQSFRFSSCPCFFFSFLSHSLLTALLPRISSVLSLSFLVSPYVLPLSFHESTLSLPGYPPPEVVWYLGNRLITASPNKIVLSEGTLTIHNVQVCLPFALFILSMKSNSSYKKRFVAYQQPFLYLP